MQPLLLPASAHFTPPSAITEPVRQVAVQAALLTVATVAAAQVSVPAVQVSAPAAVQVSAPAAVQAAAPAAVQIAAPAAVQVAAPAAVQVAAPAAVQVAAPAEGRRAEVQVFAPVEVISAELVAVGASTDFVADTPAADFSADLGPPCHAVAAADIAAVPEPGTGGLRSGPQASASWRRRCSR
jgi:hypothetical protein